MNLLKNPFKAARASVDEAEEKIMDLLFSVEDNSPEMSDRLYAFAEPFLSASKTEQEKSFVVMMAILAWNKNLLMVPGVEEHSMLDYVLSLASDRLDKKKADEQKIKAQWLSLNQSRMDRYGSHQSFILDCDFDITDGQVSLSVVSAEIPFDWSPEEVLLLALRYGEMMDAAEEYAASKGCGEIAC